MAKGNLFLGTAQNKLGDVVLYRRDGQQQSRVRVRSIANPQTEAQALQRSYLAAVPKFYAPLAGVLERSWEGLNKAKSYQAFLAANVALARSHGWYVDKGAGFTPLPYKVSKGTIAPLSYGFVDDAVTLWLPSDPDLSPLTVGGFSQLLYKSGYAEGDQLTFIVVLMSDEGDYYPTWLRFYLSGDDTTPLQSYTTQFAISEGADGNLLISEADLVVCGFAAIVSRWSAASSKWLRSTQYMVVPEDYQATLSDEATRSRAIASYQTSSTNNPSTVYLNGSNDGANIVRDLGQPWGLVNLSRVTTYHDAKVVTYTLMSDMGSGTAVIRLEGFAYNGYVLADGTLSDTNPVSGLPALVVTPLDTSLVAWLEQHGVDVDGARPAPPYPQRINPNPPQTGVYRADLPETDEMHGAIAYLVVTVDDNAKTVRFVINIMSTTGTASGLGVRDGGVPTGDIPADSVAGMFDDVVRAVYNPIYDPMGYEILTESAYVLYTGQVSTYALRL